MKKRILEKTLELKEIKGLNGFTLYQDKEGLYHIFTPSEKWFHNNQGQSEFLEVDFFDEGFNLKSSKEVSQVFLFDTENWWVGPSGKSIFKEIQMYTNATILKNSEKENFKIVLKGESEYWSSPEEENTFLNVIVHPYCLIIQTSEDVWRVYGINEKKWVQNDGHTDFASVGFVNSDSISIQNTRGKKVNIFSFKVSE